MARSRASCLLTGWWSRIVSMIWLPTVWTGLNEVMGSWKTRPISPPRIWRISGLAGSSWARSTWAPFFCNRMAPPTIRPGRSTMRRMDRAVTLLPQPLSPTMPRVGPRQKVEGGAVHRLDDALVREEVRLQVAHRQDRRRCRQLVTHSGSSFDHRVRLDGSSAVRRYQNRRTVETQAAQKGPDARRSATGRVRRTPDTPQRVPERANAQMGRFQQPAIVHTDPRRRADRRP